MKYIKSILLLLSVAIILCGCGKNKTTMSNHYEDATGYPSGQVQEIMAFYNGNLYKQQFDTNYYTEDNLPEDYRYVGKPVVVTHIPHAELEVSCVSVDAELYYSQSENCIFVKEASGENYRKLFLQ